jgi:hypothetical protein
MSKRVKLLQAVKAFAETELIAHVQQWDFTKVQTYVQRIEALQKRLPKNEAPAPRISSQYKMPLW